MRFSAFYFVSCTWFSFIWFQLLCVCSADKPKVSLVSLQETVEAVIGASVLLPCSSTKVFKLKDINVHWRHNGSEIVCDIIEGLHSETQDPDYKNRAETFPEEYERGNFSIKLHNLTYTDAGEFSCLISHSDELQTLRLIINESTAEKENGLIDQGEKTGPDVVTLSHSLWVYIVLPVVVVLIVLIAGLIFLFRKESTLPYPLLNNNQQRQK